jgi:DNA-directed RNA polymerase subunit RPC12/RpoP
MAQGFISQPTRAATAKACAETKSANWYYGYDCIACDKRFAIFDDKTKGAPSRKLLGEGHLSVACPHCGGNRTYLQARLKNFRQP